MSIGHASISENGTITGRAGDQTGYEVYTRSWYSKPWTCVLRPYSAAVAEKMAIAMEQACANNHIGYDQYERTTLYWAAKEVNWNLSAINYDVETDCSALIAVCVNAAGIAVSKDMYTGNERACLVNTGQFEALTNDKYLNSDAYLKRGDVLLGSGHTAMVLTNGSHAEGSGSSTIVDGDTALNTIVKWTGTIQSDDGEMNVRTWAGTEYPTVSFSPLHNGDQIGVMDTVKDTAGDAWYYVSFGNKKGFVHSDGVVKPESDSDGKSAHHFDAAIAGTYTTTDRLNLREGSGTGYPVILTMPAGAKVSNYGYYNIVDGIKWLYVVYQGYTGFCSAEYLQ